MRNAWILFPLAALMLLAFFDAVRPLGVLHLDLVVLVLPVLALAFERPPRAWPVLLLYPLFAYLVVRMTMIARASPSSTYSPGGPSPPPPRPPALPRAWLLAGLAVLACVHVGWALESRVTSDIGEAGVRGALRLLHGERLYGSGGTAGAPDPHIDTYGPLDYVAYLPFAVLASEHSAARLTTLFFDLLTALLLFALGRRARGPSTGVLLAFCWLAFPLTFYEDALGFNDSILAAALVATVLLAGSPVRRGALAALAV